MAIDPITAVIEGIFGGGETSAQIASQEKMLHWQLQANKEAQEQNRIWDEEDKAYNSPVASAARLRAAGISPSLMGLDNAGVALHSSAISNAEAIGGASANISQALSSAKEHFSNVIQNYQRNLLDKKRLENDINKTDDDIRHQREQDKISQLRFQLDSLKSAYEFRKMDDEHLAENIKNSSDLSQMAFNSALTGRKPVGLDAETQKKFDDALSNVDTSSTEFKFAKSELDKGISENELSALLAKQEKKYRDENPLDLELFWNRHIFEAQKVAELTHMRLSNKLQQQEYNTNELLNPIRQKQSELVFKRENARFTNQTEAIYNLKTDIQAIDARLNSINWKLFHPTEVVQLRVARERALNALDELTVGQVYRNNSGNISLNEGLNAIGDVIGNNPFRKPTLR